MTPRQDQSSLTTSKRVVLAFIFLWFSIGGICHFMFAPSFASIVPPSIPYSYAVVYVSGVLELLGAAGLIFRRTREMAGWGLVLLTIAVTPANIYMSQHPELFPAVPPLLLLLRLPLQIALIVCIAWSTRRSSAVQSPTGPTR